MAPRSYRLDPPALERAAGRRAQEAARRALRLLERHGADGARIIQNRPLIEALDPLRLHPAISVSCRSGHRMAWLALAQQGAYLVSGNKRAPVSSRPGGAFDLADEGPRRSLGFSGWVQDAEQGRGSVKPTGEDPGVFSGFPERRTHVCKKCAQRRYRGETRLGHYTHRNTELLSLYLEAVATGNRELRLI